MKNPVLLIGLLLSPSSLLAQEVSENIRVPEWTEFQSTQQKLVEQQAQLLSDLRDIRQNMRQININLLGWQDVKNEIQMVAGKEVKCTAFENKYNPVVEVVVLVLAFLGVVFMFNGGVNFIKNLFTKKPASGV